MATLPVPELPVYVRLTPGQSIEVEPCHWGENLALAPGVAATATGQALLAARIEHTLSRDPALRRTYGVDLLRVLAQLYFCLGDAARTLDLMAVLALEGPGDAIAPLGPARDCNQDDVVAKALAHGLRQFVSVHPRHTDV